MTALMFAIKVGSFDVVKMLVEHSANIFATDSVSEKHHRCHTILRRHNRDDTNNHTIYAN